MFEANLFHVLPDPVAQRLSLVFFSFALWCSLFLLVYSRPTSQRLKSKAERENVGVRTHRAELATRVTATIHAVLVSVGAASLVFFRKDSNLFVYQLFKPLTWPSFITYNEDAIAYACFSLAYFVADFMLCVIQVEEQGIQFVVHALVGMSGCIFCVFNSEGLLYLMLLMLFEVSTPFLNLMWWLKEYQFEHSLIYTLNGIMLVFTFTTFRLIIGCPVLLKMVYELHTEPEKDRHSIGMRVIFTLAPLAMMILNLAWGYKLWRGMFKTLGWLPSRPKKE
jgi:hypothetical protein